MSAVAPQLSGSRRRYWLGLLVFLLGILVGWWLAPRCKSCGEVTPSAAAGGGAKLSGDAGPGKRDSGPLHDAKGDKTMGADSGQAPPGEKAVGHSPPVAEQPTRAGEQDLNHVDGAGPDAAGVPDLLSGQTLKATDFRYDKTGLPRYAQSVATTASTLSHDIGSSNYHSTATIETSSRFEDVVAWYKAQLPQGWSAQVVGDVGALAQQVSVGNILSALTAAKPDSTPKPDSAPRPDSATTRPQSAAALSVAMFAPPPNTAGDPLVMIQQGTDHTVRITMSKNGTDP